LLPGCVLSFKNAAFGRFQRQGTDVGIAFGMSLKGYVSGLGKVSSKMVTSTMMTNSKVVTSSLWIMTR